MVRVYKKKQFAIYSDLSGSYIIHNTNKEFAEGHTHIKNYKTAKFIVDLAFHKSIPKKKLSTYLYDSIIRISNDNIYKNRIMRLRDSVNENRSSMGH